MKTVVYHHCKPHQPLQSPLHFYDNLHHQGCVVIPKDSLCTPPTKHSAFGMGMTYNTRARPGVQG
jgi:hypothetical protein